MAYLISENVAHTFYPYEHPFDRARRIELGGGKCFYVYKDREPYLVVQARNHTFFTRAIIFQGSLVIGDAGAGIHIINLADFSVRDVEIDGYFGYFVVYREVLYVLGMRSILAFDRDFRLLWKSDPLAVDGVVYDSITDDTMTVECEMDPPGGWITQTISLKDGKRLP